MLDNIIVGCYLLSILILGVLTVRKVKTLADFSVAGRSFSSWVIFATLSASFIGGGFSIGNAEKVFIYGIANIFALWGFSLKELLVATILAPRMGKYSDVLSPGQIMERSYGRASRVITGFFSILLCAGIVGAQVGAIGYIFEVFLGIPQLWGIFIGCGIVILYSTLGGMRAVVLTDIIQFIVLAIGIPLTLIIGIHHAGGIAAIKSAIPATHFRIIGGDISLWGFISLFLIFLLGETLVPPYVQRLFIGKNVKHTARGTLFSGLFSFPFFAVTGGIGLIALTLNPELNPNMALPYVIKTVLPIGLKGFVIAGMISIVMSSADSFLNSASIALINDIVIPLKRNPLGEKQKLLLAKMTNLIAGVFSVVFAIKIKSILDILIYAYNFWAPIILIPLAAAILGVKAKFRCFLVGALCGIAGVLVWKYLLHAPGGIDGLVIGAFCNFIAFGIMVKVTRN